MKHWCVRHNQVCDYANSGGDCNVSACQTVIGGDRKITNREWLETLPDEEFVKVMYGSCRNCVANGNIKECESISCRDGRIKWLKQEYKENSDDK